MTVMWGENAVKGVDNQWRALGQWEEQLEAHRAQPPRQGSPQRLRNSLPAPDLYTKLSRITSYIQKNIRYFIIEKGIGGLQAHYAGDISEKPLWRLQRQNHIVDLDASGSWHSGLLPPCKQ